MMKLLRKLKVPIYYYIPNKCEHTQLKIAVQCKKTNNLQIQLFESIL